MDGFTDMQDIYCIMMSYSCYKKISMAMIMFMVEAAMSLMPRNAITRAEVAQILLNYGPV